MTRARCLSSSVSKMFIVPHNSCLGQPGFVRGLQQAVGKAKRKEKSLETTTSTHKTGDTTLKHLHDSITIKSAADVATPKIFNSQLITWANTAEFNGAFCTFPSFNWFILVWCPDTLAVLANSEGALPSCYSHADVWSGAGKWLPEQNKLRRVKSETRGDVDQPDFE